MKAAQAVGLEEKEEVKKPVLAGEVEKAIALGRSGSTPTFSFRMQPVYRLHLFYVVANLIAFPAGIAADNYSHVKHFLNRPVYDD